MVEGFTQMFVKKNVETEDGSISMDVMMEMLETMMGVTDSVMLKLDTPAYLSQESQTYL